MNLDAFSLLPKKACWAAQVRQTVRTNGIEEVVVRRLSEEAWTDDVSDNGSNLSAWQNLDGFWMRRPKAAPAEPLAVQKLDDLAVKAALLFSQSG